MIMVIAVNAGASVSSVFGSIILKDLAGFTADEAVLLNMPFGALQFVSILGASWLAYRFKRKSPFLLGLVTIVIVGVALMVALPKTPKNKGGLLAGYYLIAFVYAINPLLISWMGGNCQESYLLHLVQRRQLYRQHHYPLHLRCQVPTAIRKYPHNSPIATNSLL
jgi:predicted MFS family arabinose efflux permease